MANRSLAAKHDKGKRQTIALVQVEMTKACYMARKPAVPSYDGTMVRRIETPVKARKTVYRNAKPATLVKTGLGTIGSWDRVGTCTLIKRAR